MFRRLLFPALLAVLVVGCKPSSSSPSQLRIVNGKEIPLTQEPAVVKLHGSKSLCTGTFIKPTVVLTAAHCVGDDIPFTNTDSEVKAKIKVFLSDGRKAESIRVLRHPKYGWNSERQYHDIRYDLALIFIAKESAAKDFLPIASAYPKLGEKVKLVGFGLESTPETAGKKRSGNNVIGATDTDFFNVHAKTGAYGIPGDSGSPLITEKGIAGVAVTETPDGSCYANLFRQEVRDFLALAD